MTATVQDDPIAFAPLPRPTITESQIHAPFSRLLLKKRDSKRRSQSTISVSEAGEMRKHRGTIRTGY